MIRSMTGFGAGCAKEGEEEITVEVRSVNHKFCEVKARLPHEFASLEPDLVRAVRARLTRGSVEVHVRRVSGAQRSAMVPRADLALARAYAAVYEQIGRELGLDGRVPFGAIVEADGVIALEERAADLAEAGRGLAAALGQALEQLIAMRTQEGKALAEDLLSRVERIREQAAELARAAPQMVEAYRERLQVRVQELSKGMPVDPARLAQEVAIFADRCDIAEELTRLHSHCDQFVQIVESGEPAGRRLEFLIQEMGREVNTSSSKSQSAEIASLVVSMKAELERLREQVLNVE